MAAQAAEDAKVGRDATADSERLRFLSEAGLALVSSLDYSATLQQVADLSLGLLCDYCIFDVFDDFGSAMRVAWAHSNAKFAHLGDIGKFAPPVSANHPMSEVVRTGKAVFVPDFDEAWMTRITWSAGHYELLRELNPHSVMFVPLTAHGSTVGAAIFAFSDSPRRYTESDLDLALDLGRRAGLAVVQARQYEALQASAARLRQMTDDQRVLIEELNHRVKNTLAIVQAMAAQTMRSGGVPEAVGEAFSARLMALARAHDLLTRSTWESADIVDLVNQTIEMHRAASGSRIVAHGASVRLRPHLALSLAMSLYELATNATKYGALSNNSGTVAIDWRVEEGPQPILELKWQEQGGPAVTPPTRRGFGSRLIQGQLAAEPEGSAELRYEPGGLVAVLRAGLGG